MKRNTKPSATEANDSEQPTEAGYQTRALARGLTLLGLFSAQRPELALAELAELAELDKATALRLLRSLEQHRFLARDDETGRYRLGLKIFELSAAYHGSQWLIQAATSALDTLAQRCQQTAELGVLDGGDIVALSVAYPARPLRRLVTPGERFRATCTSIGKMLLSDLSQDQLAAFLRAYPPQRATPQTIMELGRLRAEIATAADRGYAVDEEETLPGVSCVAAPVRDVAGRIVAAIAVSGPSAEFQGERKQGYVADVTTLAAGVSAQLGYPADVEVRLPAWSARGSTESA